MTRPTNDDFVARSVGSRTRPTDDDLAVPSFDRWGTPVQCARPRTYASRTDAFINSICDTGSPFTLGTKQLRWQATSPFASKVGPLIRFNVSLLHAKAGRFNNRIEAKVERSRAGAVHPTIEPIGNLSKG